MPTQRGPDPGLVRRPNDGGTNAGSRHDGPCRALPFPRQLRSAIFLPHKGSDVSHAESGAQFRTSKGGHRCNIEGEREMMEESRFFLGLFDGHSSHRNLSWWA